MEESTVKDAAPIHQWTHDKSRLWLVKCLNRDGTSGLSERPFTWPKDVGAEVMPVVSGPNQGRDSECDTGGLFGWPWGMGVGEGREPDACASWIVFSADPKDVYDCQKGKAKAVKARVEFYGDMATAMYMTSEGRIAWIQARSQGSASATGESGSASATGEKSTAVACGYAGRVRADKPECAIFAVERDIKNNIISAACGITGRDGLKPCEWYTCKAGKLVAEEK